MPKPLIRNPLLNKVNKLYICQSSHYHLLRWIHKITQVQLYIVALFFRMDRFFHRPRALQNRAPTVDQSIKSDFPELIEILTPQILRTPNWKSNLTGRSMLDPNLALNALTELPDMPQPTAQNSENGRSRAMVQSFNAGSYFPSLGAHRGVCGYELDNNRPYAMARLEMGMSSQKARLPHVSENTNSFQIYKQIRLPWLREDFYSTRLATLSSWVRTPWEVKKFSHDELSRSLVCHLLSSDVIVYSDGHWVRIWSQQWGSSAVLSISHHDNPVTCVAISNFGYLLVGYESGNIIVADLIERVTAGITSISSLYNDSSSKRHSSSSTCPTNVIWTHQTLVSSSSNLKTDQRPAASQDTTSLQRLGRKIEFFVGDSEGQVAKVAVVGDNPQGLQFKLLYILPLEYRHEDSICSMALDKEEKYLSVGGSDNRVKIWRHTPSDYCLEQRPENQGGTDYKRNEISNKVLHFYDEIAQKSAVRALAFSPGNLTMLAVGGGRHDRTLRVYEIRDGTPASEVVCKVRMPAQIVDVVWLSNWEVLVALGHSRTKQYHGLAEVVDVNTGNIIAKIPGEGYALEAGKTQQGFCITTSLSMLHCGTWSQHYRPHCEEPHSIKIGGLKMPGLR